MRDRKFLKLPLHCVNSANIVVEAAEVSNNSESSGDGVSNQQSASHRIRKHRVVDFREGVWISKDHVVNDEWLHEIVLESAWIDRHAGDVRSRFRGLTTSWRHFLATNNKRNEDHASAPQSEVQTKHLTQSKCQPCCWDGLLLAGRLPTLHCEPIIVTRGYSSLLEGCFDCGNPQNEYRTSYGLPLLRSARMLYFGGADSLIPRKPVELSDSVIEPSGKHLQESNNASIHRISNEPLEFAETGLDEFSTARSILLHGNLVSKTNTRATTTSLPMRAEFGDQFDILLRDADFDVRMDLQHPSHTAPPQTVMASQSSNTSLKDPQRDPTAITESLPVISVGADGTGIALVHRNKEPVSLWCVLGGSREELAPPDNINTVVLPRGVFDPLWSDDESSSDDFDHLQPGSDSELKLQRVLVNSVDCSSDFHSGPRDSATDNVWTPQGASAVPRSRGRVTGAATEVESGELSEVDELEPNNTTGLRSSPLWVKAASMADTADWSIPMQLGVSTCMGAQSPVSPLDQLTTAQGVGVRQVNAKRNWARHCPLHCNHINSSLSAQHAQQSPNSSVRSSQQSNSGKPQRLQSAGSSELGSTLDNSYDLLSWPLGQESNDCGGGVGLRQEPIGVPPMCSCVDSKSFDEWTAMVDKLNRSAESSHMSGNAHDDSERRVSPVSDDSLVGVCAVCQGLLYFPYSVIEVPITRDLQTADQFARLVPLGHAVDIYCEGTKCTISLVCRNSEQEAVCCLGLKLSGLLDSAVVFDLCSVHYVPFSRPIDHWNLMKLCRSNPNDPAVRDLYQRLKGAASKREKHHDRKPEQKLNKIRSYLEIDRILRRVSRAPQLDENNLHCNGPVHGWEADHPERRRTRERNRRPYCMRRRGGALDVFSENKITGEELLVWFQNQRQHTELMMRS
eukprot:Lankesteria_metandrocarpae@DN1948_c0_g1_i1.p1